MKYMLLRDIVISFKFFRINLIKQILLFFLRLDVNECTSIKPCKCASSTGGCNANCQNLPGNYKCSCRFGFQLMFDRKTCVGKKMKIMILTKIRENISTFLPTFSRV